MARTTDTFTIIITAGTESGGGGGGSTSIPADIRIDDDWESFTWERPAASTGRTFNIDFEYKTGFPRADAFLAPVWTLPTGASAPRTAYIPTEPTQKIYRQGIGIRDADYDEWIPGILRVWMPADAVAGTYTVELRINQPD